MKILYKKKNIKGPGYHWIFLGVRVVDIFNPKKWVSFIVGKIRGQVIKPHIIRQIHMRHIMCKQCIEAGRCIDCGCKMPEKSYVFNETCSMGYWGEIEEDEDEYERIEKEFGIEWMLSVGKGESKINIK